MRKLTLALAATTALTFFAGAAAAQDWMPIDTRQAVLDQRIDAGVRSGELTRNEAVRLRGEFREIASMESRYRATDGLSNWERQDLDARFDRLSAQIRAETHDVQQRGERDRNWNDNRDRRDGDRAYGRDGRDGRGYGDRADNRDWFGGHAWTDSNGRWVNVQRRKMQLDRRIDQGVRSGQLTRSEAIRLRAEFNAIARLEYRYRRDGLSLRERASLDERFDLLADQIRIERSDRERLGYNTRRY